MSVLSVTRAPTASRAPLVALLAVFFASSLAVAAGLLAPPAAAASSDPPRQRSVESVPVDSLSTLARPLLGERPGARPEEWTGEALPDSASRRPRIGLVLGGGGARGIAHVGVLKALEEMHVPVDCVAGTSMGSVVGSLYALGLSADEVEDAILGIDWIDVFSDRPKWPQRTFHRKEEDRPDLLNFEVGISHGRFVLPRGLIAGQKFTFAIPVPQFYVPYGRTFDDLPRPFRAVATDLGTGDAVVLFGGELYRAIRASMAIPGVFPPVEIDGRVLADGGLALNVPVDVARAMGADVVIAVDVGRPRAERPAEELKTLVGVSKRAADVMFRQNVRPQLALADVVIRPELGDRSAADFDARVWMVARGEEAGRAAAAALSKYALSDEAWRQEVARRRPFPLRPVRVNRIAVDNRSRLDTRVIVDQLTVRPTAALDFGRLEGDVSRICALGLFESVDFGLREQATGAPGDTPGGSPGATTTTTAAPARVARDNVLVIRADEKSCGPSLLSFGLTLSDDLAGEGRYDLRARWIRRAINPLGGELIALGQFGSDPAAEAEYRQPLDFGQRSFLSLKGSAESRLRGLFAGRKRIADYRSRTARTAADLGWEVGRFGELSAGLVYGFDSAHAKVGDPDLAGLSGRIGGWTGRFAFDALDGRDFPRRGTAGEVVWYRASRGLGASAPYDRISGTLRGYASIGLNTVFAAASGGSDLGRPLPGFDLFRPGGLLSFSGYQQGELAGRTAGVARAGYWRAINPHIGQLRPNHYLGFWLEAGNAWPSRQQATLRDLRFAGTVALGARTIFGPLFLAYGRAEGGRDAFYLTLGSAAGMMPPP